MNFVEIMCMIYAYVLAVAGFSLVLGLVQEYCRRRPEARLIVMVLAIIASITFGFIPFVIIGIYAMAIHQTNWQKKRRTRT